MKCSAAVASITTTKQDQSHDQGVELEEEHLASSLAHAALSVAADRTG